MKTLAAAALLLALAVPATAQDGALTDEQMTAITELLASLRCEVTGEIEVEDGEIGLDDVICAGGQFDVTLNRDLHIIGARPE